MTDDRSFERAARSWLEVGPTRAPERALEAAFDQIASTPQERDWHVPWRLPKMTTPLRVASAAVIGVLAIGGAIYLVNPLGSSSGIGGPGPTPSPSSMPSPTPAPLALPEGVLSAGSYFFTPFAAAGSDACFAPPQEACIDSTNDDSVRVTLTVPDGWSANPAGVWPTDGDAAEAYLLVVRGASLYDDPCRSTANSSVPPEIPVGPTVDDFVDAVAAHPLLDATTPTDVTLAGYTGRYLEVQVPADISGCDVYRPWEPWLYTQGPGELWHLWVLDVDGVRVVVQSVDLPSTSAEIRTQLQAIVESIQIEP